MREVAPPGTAVLAPGVHASELAGPLRAALENPTHRAAIAEAGRRNAARFRWDVTAAQTLQALAELVDMGVPHGH
jgi:glycosyltransferase involved in cell wall biosynthesis